jgi:hypothetical protein
VGTKVNEETMMMLKLMREGVWCHRCTHRCEKVHGWRGNGGPTQEGLEEASLMQSRCTVMGMAPMSGAGWSELIGCLMTTRARAGVKRSHVSLYACKLEV